MENNNESEAKMMILRLFFEINCKRLKGILKESCCKFHLSLIDNASNSFEFIL